MITTFPKNYVRMFTTLFKVKANHCWGRCDAYRLFYLQRFQCAC